jgi:hypothetical protein
MLGHPQNIYLSRAIGASSSANITNEQILQLYVDISVTNKLERNISASGEYIYIVLPSVFSPPLIDINGLRVTAWQKEQRMITFPGQAPTQYTIFRSAYSITSIVRVETS